MSRGLLVGLLLAIPLARAPQIQAQWVETERGDSLAEALFRRLSPPGLSIAVARADGKGARWQLGTANLSVGTRVNRNTRFRIGSDSKLFTTAIAARLVAAGRLSLDAPISTYLPELPPAYRALTVRLLAGHLAGIRHYGPGEFINTVAYPTVSTSLGVFLKDTLLAAPGARYFYSSYGFNLLGAVLEAASGDPFATLLHQEVIEPLGLDQTALEPSGRLLERQARPYSRDSSGVFQPSPLVDLSDRWPSGGLVSTAEELAKFALEIFRPDYLPDSLRALMLTPQRTASGTPTQVGLGWRIARDSLGRQYLHHGGSAMGGRAFLLVYPKERVAVALLANTEANFGEADALAFASLVLGR
jgi:CubicO group peptidase (beta-lactamase class C family)